MTFYIQLIEAACSETGALLESVTILNRDHQALLNAVGNARVLAAVLCDGQKKVLLDYSVGDSFESQGAIERYDHWFLRQDALDFWRVAFSWSLYWDAVCGSLVASSWPDLLEPAIPTEPSLSFLDISAGYLHWDFQLEMIYRLCDDDYVGARDFRKAWNARHPHASIIVESMRLADGRVLGQVLEKHMRHGVSRAVRSVPMVAPSQLLLARNWTN